MIHFEGMEIRGWKLASLVVIAILIFLWLSKAPLMGAYISDKLDIPVTLRAISIWPTHTTIRHFKIRDPSDVDSNIAFSTNKIHIDYQYSKLTNDPNEIDQIIFDEVYLNIELLSADGTDNNWKRMASQIPIRENPREVIVRKLILKNMTVVIQGRGAEKLGLAGTQHFDQMEFEDLDSREGFPTKELIANLFQKAGLSRFINDLLAPAKKN